MFEFNVLNETTTSVNNNNDELQRPRFNNSFISKILIKDETMTTPSNTEDDEPIINEATTARLMTTTLVTAEGSDLEDDDFNDKISYYENVHNRLASSNDLEHINDYEVFVENLPENSFIENDTNTAHNSSFSSCSLNSSSNSFNTKQRLERPFI